MQNYKLLATSFRILLLIPILLFVPYHLSAQDMNSKEIVNKLRDDKIINDDLDLLLSLNNFFETSTDLKERTNVIEALENYALWHKPSGSPSDIESVQEARSYLVNYGVSPNDRGRWDFAGHIPLS